MKNLMRFAMLGGALSFMTACALGGHQGAIGNNPTKSSGIKRYVMNSNVGYFQPDGTLKSTTGAIKYDASKVSVVQGRILRQATNRNQGFDICYGGTCIASTQGEIAWNTSDTNGDGWVLGNVGTCNLSSGIGYIGAAPASAFFQDVTTCPNGGDADFSTSMSEYNMGGGFGVAVQDQDPGGVNAYRNLPISVMQDIINSIDSSDVRTEIRDGVKHQIVRATITNVRIGGASYRPVGVAVEIEDMKPLIRVTKTNPGAKLLAAWMANQIEQGLNRGATKLHGTVTINGSATLSTDMIPSTVLHTGVSRANVDRLREFATSNLRGE